MPDSSSSSSRSSSSASEKAAAPYCEEYDLTAERPSIMQYGVNSWDDKINAATDIVNEDLELRWYRGAAENFGVDWRQYPFDPELLFSSPRVKRLAVYKSLELIYRFLMKDSPPDQDAFEHQSKLYAKLYYDELKELGNFGVDYDWDASGGLSYDEERQPSQRRLTRC
jgi:hypothetical protein